MKPKQTIDPNVAGEEFKKLLAEDRIALKDIRAAKATRKQQLKAALTVVWEALGKGITVNGYNTREDWAKKFAGYSRRQCEYIVYGRPSREGGNANRGSQVPVLKRGSQFEVDGVVYRIPTEKELGYEQGFIARVYQPSGKKFVKGEWANLDFKGCIIVEEKSAKPVPITHLKHSPRKTVCMTRFPNRKFKGLVFAAKGEEITCPDCIAIRDRVVVKGTLQEARERILAKKAAKQPTTHKMNGDRRTFCGKTPGDTLAKDAPMADEPTCRNCQVGELNHEARLYREMTPQQKRARTLADRKIEHTGQPNVTHRLGLTTAGGGQDTRMQSYALCGRKLSGSSWTTKERHITLGLNEPLTCEKCIELEKQKAQVTVVINDSPTEPEYDKEAYAKAENHSQKVCIKGSPENLAWHAEREHQRQYPYVDPNEGDEFEGERD